VAGAAFDRGECVDVPVQATGNSNSAESIFRMRAGSFLSGSALMDTGGGAQGSISMRSAS
jgi:hypothetical protein